MSIISPEEFNQHWQSVQKLQQPQPAGGDISLCKSCWCMTHTVTYPDGDFCGKCKRQKPAGNDKYNANQPKIRGIQCPACGSHDSIFIGTGGYLTCSWLECPEPSFGDAVKGLELKVKDLEELTVKPMPGATVQPDEMLNSTLDKIEYPHKYITESEDALPYLQRQLAAKVLQENALKQYAEAAIATAVPDETIDALIRDACSVVPVPKSLYRKRLNSVIATAVTEGKVELVERLREQSERYIYSMDREADTTAGEDAVPAAVLDAELRKLRGEG